jgi:hypothetical protein
MEKKQKNKRKWISDDDAQKLFEDSIPEAAKEMGLKNPLLSKQRYRIMGDESGHDYFIPIEKEEDFRRWVEWTENDGDSDSGYIGEEFEDNRIDGRFTFTDPRLEK